MAQQPMFNHLSNIGEYYNMKLMSFGNMIKVLEPESLQEKIYKWLEKTIEVYK